jgi:hypothetical protein
VRKEKHLNIIERYFGEMEFGVWECLGSTFCVSEKFRLVVVQKA